MAAQNAPYEMMNAVKRVVDPGSGGTFTIPGHDCVCAVTTGGAESRKLPAASGVKAFTRVSVLLEVDGGDLTLTVVGGGTLDGSNTTATFDAAKEMLDLIVLDINGTHEWFIVTNVGSVAMS